jgi:hypothetical protein
MSQPIFVTGAERSGSSLIAKILQICGVATGETTNMVEHIEMRELCRRYLTNVSLNGYLMVPTEKLSIPADWKKEVEHCWKSGSVKTKPWMFKSSLLSQTWLVWHYAYPDAKWIIVRRKTPDIVYSCGKTAYMNIFKEEKNRIKAGTLTEEDGWRWWVRQYEKKWVEMIEAGVNCKQVWPERMVTGDYHQIYETLEWLGLKWNSKIVETIDPMLNKSRRKL